MGHESATFIIICDRGVTHGLVRHRIGVAYSQESTRYCKYDDGVQVIAPPGLTGDAYNAWNTAMHGAQEYYDEMLLQEVSPQIARSVLPNSLKTQIGVTMNFRVWRHFLKLRCAKAAHPQIREIANMVRDWFRENYPVIVEDIV